MVIIFKRIYQEPIINGFIIHTIRRDGNNRWRAGRGIIFKAGSVCFHNADCVSTQKIQFYWACNNAGQLNESWRVMVYIDGVNVTTNEAIMNALIKNEGFPDRVSFFNCWYKVNFTGKIIHWTDFKYEV